MESNTVNDPAPDDDVALGLCDSFDFDEVELFSNLSDNDELPYDVDGTVGVKESQLYLS